MSTPSSSLSPAPAAVLRATRVILDSLYSTERGTSRERAIQDLCSVAESTQSAPAQQHYNEFCCKLLRNIEACCSGDKGDKKFKEKALIRFHHTRVDCLWPLWQKVFKDLGIASVPPALVQSINQYIFNEVLLKIMKVDKPVAGKACEPAISMSAMDENAVRYSAGYVSLTMLRTYEKQGSVKAAGFVECLSNMAVDGDDSR